VAAGGDRVTAVHVDGGLRLVLSGAVLVGVATPVGKSARAAWFQKRTCDVFCLPVACPLALSSILLKKTHCCAVRVFYLVTVVCHFKKSDHFPF